MKLKARNRVKRITDIFSIFTHLTLINQNKKTIIYNFSGGLVRLIFFI
jgi:hypothetical protein